MIASEARMSRKKTLIQAITIALALVGGLGMVQALAAPERPLYLQDLTPFRKKSLAQKVQELADREEIKELTAIYAHRVAHGHSIANLFTDDGAYINRRPDRPVNEVRGRKALDAYFQDRAPTAEHPLPMIHNFIISIKGDEATGINSNELRITEEGRSMIASGYYQDRYRRVNGRWRFVVRDISFVHWVPIQQGWARPVAAK